MKGVLRQKTVNDKFDNRNVNKYTLYNEYHIYIDIYLSLQLKVGQLIGGASASSNTTTFIN